MSPRPRASVAAYDSGPSGSCEVIAACVTPGVAASRVVRPSAQSTYATHGSLDGIRGATVMLTTPAASHPRSNAVSLMKLRVSLTAMTTSAAAPAHCAIITTPRVRPRLARSPEPELSAGRMRFEEPHEAIGIAAGQGPHRDAVGDREDRGGGADAEGERGDGGQREARMPGQGAGRVSQVARHRGRACYRDVENARFVHSAIGIPTQTRCASTTAALGQVRFGPRPPPVADRGSTTHCMNR